MACQDIELLKILSVFRILINTITIIIPVILIIFIIIDITKTTSSGDVDTKKLFKSISKRLVAAIMVFILPHLINISLSFFADKAYYLDCYTNANKDYILETAVAIADEEIDLAYEGCRNGHNYSLYDKARAAVKKIPDKEVRNSYESQLSSLKSACEKK